MNQEQRLASVHATLQRGDAGALSQTVAPLNQLTTAVLAIPQQASSFSAAQRQEVRQQLEFLRRRLAEFDLLLQSSREFYDGWAAARGLQTSGYSNSQSVADGGPQLVNLEL